MDTYQQFKKYINNKYGSRYGTGICEKAVIAMENQTYFGENLQFSLITEGFQSHYSFGKTFSFSSKTEGNTNFSVRLKLKVFLTKTFCFFLQKLKEN